MGREEKKKKEKKKMMREANEGNGMGRGEKVQQGACQHANESRRMSRAGACQHTNESTNKHTNARAGAAGGRAGGGRAQTYRICWASRCEALERSR